MIAFRISVYPSRDSDAAPTVTATIKFDVRASEGCHAAAKIFSLLPVGQPEFVHVDCSQSSGSRFKPLVDALAGKCPGDPLRLPFLRTATAGWHTADGCEVQVVRSTSRLPTSRFEKNNHQSDRRAHNMVKMLPPIRTLLGNRKRSSSWGCGCQCQTRTRNYFDK